MTPVHPIEQESYRILDERVDLSALAPLSAAVVRRIIHASADPLYAETMVCDDAVLEAAVGALAQGAPVVVDVAMVSAGITGVPTICLLGEVGRDAEPTRSALAMRRAAARHPRGAVFVVGCAPSALAELVELADRDDGFSPALVIGLPVGFVGAAQSKERLRASRLPSLSNVGERGGAAVAAAALNALARVALGDQVPR